MKKKRQEKIRKKKGRKKRKKRKEKERDMEQQEKDGGSCNLIAKQASEQDKTTRSLLSYCRGGSVSATKENKMVEKKNSFREQIIHVCRAKPSVATHLSCRPFHPVITPSFAPNLSKSKKN